MRGLQKGDLLCQGTFPFGAGKRRRNRSIHREPLDNGVGQNAGCEPGHLRWIYLSGQRIAPPGRRLPGTVAVALRHHADVESAPVGALRSGCRLRRLNVDAPPVRGRFARRLLLIRPTRQGDGGAGRASPSAAAVSIHCRLSPSVTPSSRQMMDSPRRGPSVGYRSRRLSRMAAGPPWPLRAPLAALRLARRSDLRCAKRSLMRSKNAR